MYLLAYFPKAAVALNDLEGVQRVDCVTAKGMISIISHHSLDPHTGSNGYRCASLSALVTQKTKNVCDKES